MLLFRRKVSLKKYLQPVKEELLMYSGKWKDMKNHLAQSGTCDNDKELFGISVEQKHSEQKKKDEEMPTEI